MTDRPKRVLIVGGGLGGLTLAQLFLRSPHGDAEVVVFERDATETAREQGYSIGITNEPALRILKSLNVPGLEAMFNLVAPLNGFKITGSSLRELFSFGFGSGSPYETRLVSRWGLRNCLTSNLKIIWGKKFVRYEEKEDRVILYFEDGTIEEGDVLVGADGANSGVRKQKLPSLAVENIHITTVGSTIPLEEAARVSPAVVKACGNYLLRIFGRNGHTLLAFCYVRTEKGNAAEKALLWALSWPIEKGEMSPEVEDLVRNPNGQQVLDLVAKKVEKFFDHPELAIMIKHTPSDHILGPKSLFSAVPQRSIAAYLSPTFSRVVLLGDAAHPMTTHRGLGANTAITDAYDLFNALKESDWKSALRKYEEKMYKRGNEAVSSTRMIHAKGWGAIVRNSFLWTMGCIASTVRVITRIVFFWR